MWGVLPNPYLRLPYRMIQESMTRPYRGQRVAGSSRVEARSKPLQSKIVARFGERVNWGEEVPGTCSSLRLVVRYTETLFSVMA